MPIFDKDKIAKNNTMTFEIFCNTKINKSNNSSNNYKSARSRAKSYCSSAKDLKISMKMS